MGAIDEFERVAATWDPPPQVTHDVVTTHVASAFAAMMDVPTPVTTDGDQLPPLWHWFLFPEIHAQSALGDDGHPWEAPLMPPLGPRRRMFGGGRLHVEHPLRCGDHVQRSSQVASVRAREGRSGPLLLVTLRHDFTVDGEHRLTEEQDIVYRPPAEATGTPGPPPVRRPANTRDADWHLALIPGPVLLFRFSALTSNAHRIHYDRAFTQEVENHPELVVQGPLLALLLLELPRRHAFDRRLVGFSWRARAPVYAGQHLHVNGADSEAQATLVAGTEAHPEAVLGTAEFEGGAA